MRALKMKTTCFFVNILNSKVIVVITGRIIENLKAVMHF